MLLSAEKVMNKFHEIKGINMSIRQTLSEGARDVALVAGGVAGGVARFAVKRVMLPVVVAVMVLGATACGSEAVIPPQDAPGITTQTPETPAPQTPAPETPAPQPDAPVQNDPPVGDSGDGGDGGDGPDGTNDPTEDYTPDEPAEEITTPPIDRNRHVEIRTGGTSASESGINLQGRNFGTFDEETLTNTAREIAEDANYAFADQLKGPDGSPMAVFTPHFQHHANPDATRGHTAWITLDIKATGESILVNSADFGRRGFRVDLITGEQGGTRIDGGDFGKWLAERAGM